LFVSVKPYYPHNFHWCESELVASITGIPSYITGNQIFWSINGGLQPSYWYPHVTTGKTFNFVALGPGTVTAHIAPYGVELSFDITNVFLHDATLHVIQPIIYANCGEPVHLERDGYYWWRLTNEEEGELSNEYGEYTEATFYTNGWHYVLFHVFNTCGLSPFPNYLFTIYVSGCSSALVYPNPVSDVLTIEIDSEEGIETTRRQTINYNVRLFDSHGNLLRQTTTAGGSIQFNVANLPPGIYYLHIFDDINQKPEIHQIIVER
jgi:hypothetical protein